MARHLLVLIISLRGKIAFTIGGNVSDIQGKMAIAQGHFDEAKWQLSPQGKMATLRGKMGALFQTKTLQQSDELVSLHLSNTSNPLNKIKDLKMPGGSECRLKSQDITDSG